MKKKSLFINSLRRNASIANVDSNVKQVGFEVRKCWLESFRKMFVLLYKFCELLRVDFVLNNFLTTMR